MPETRPSDPDAGPGERTPRADPGAESPHPVRLWPFASRIAARSIGGFLEDRGPHLAASIAYRALFSLVPLAAFLSAVLALVLRAIGQQADVTDTIVRNIPLDAEGQQTLRDVLNGAMNSATTVGVVGLLVLLWAASGMMGAIRLGLNLAWHVERPRPFLRGKAVDVLLVLGAALLILCSFALSLGTRMARHYAPDVAGGWVSMLLGTLPPLVLAFAAVLFLYSVVPASRPGPRDVWPAALIVAVVFVAMQSLFGVYVEHFGNYNALYGSLGAVFGFLFFVYAAALVFLLGAELASEWPRVRAELARGDGDDLDGPPLTERIRGALRGLLLRDDERR